VKKLLIGLMLACLWGSQAWAAKTITMTTLAQQNTAVQLKVQMATPDSAVKKWVLWKDGSKYDSITSSATNPDTFKVTPLTWGTVYSFYVVATDSVESVTQGTASACTTTFVTASTFIAYDTTCSRIKLTFEIADMDSGLKKIVLLQVYQDSSDNPIRKDSITASITNPDSLTINGLHRGGQYFYYLIVTDSTATDTTMVSAGVTGIQHSDLYDIERMILATPVAQETTYQNFKIAFSLTNPDSGVKKIVIVRRTPPTYNYVTASDTVWVRSDSGSTLTKSGSAYRDTLYGATGIMTLRQNQTYTYCVIVTDSTGVDTLPITLTPTYLITTESFQWDDYNSGDWNRDNLYHWVWAFDESQDSLLTPPVDISDYTWAKCWVRLFGEDNNHSFDSITVSILSYEFGVLTVNEAIVSVDPDTGRASDYWILRTYNAIDSMGSTQTSVRNWSDMIQFKVVVKDSAAAVGDTMDLDPRYGEIYLLLK